MRKRVFAFLMTLVLLVSMIPTSVFAEDTAGIYQIGDTVTNDGAAQPAGATVENSYWAREDVYDTSALVCTKEAHDHGDACYQFLHTVWTLTAVPAQDEPVEEPSERTCEEGCILTSEEEHLENGGECLVWVGCTKSEGCEGPEGHEGECYVSAPMADHTVSFTVKNGNSTVREAEIMIVNAAGETVDYIQTNRYGQAEIDLPDGTYTAIVSYSSGSYDYEGEAEFTVNGKDLTGDNRVNISVERVYSEDYFQGIYDQTSYFNHVDIRVMGTYTTGTTIDLTTYDIKLSNVSVRVDNPSVSNYQDYSFSFTNGNETYEWRKTNIRVHKEAVVSLTCDIVNSRTGEVMKSGFNTSFSGEAAFVQAIKNCDINQGLDFIVNPQEIIEAAFYEVNYQWAVVDANGNVIGSLPAGVATLPGRTTGYKAEDSHTIDTIYREGDYVVVESADGSTATAYQFHGWDWWSHEGDNDLDKNAIGSSQSALSITDDTIIYGVWVAVPLEKATSHLTITKTFVGNGEDLPENYTIVVTGPRGSDYDIPLSMFTESNGVYTYSMPVYTEGTFTIQEMGYTIDGYKEPAAIVTVTDSSDSGHEHLTEVSGSNKGTEVQVQVELHWQEAGSSASTADSTQHDYLGTVAFTNTYEKELGDPIYNLPNLRINKLDAADRSILPGATFELRDASGKAVFSGTSDESGYIYFFNIPVDTTAENHRTVYTLVETQAPAGYYEGYAKYQVILTLKENSPTQILQDGKYHPYYEYDMEVLVNLGDGEWVDSQHFSVGTTGNRFRLAAFNFKIDGQLTITKDFAGFAATDTITYPDGLVVNVIGPDGYSEDVTLTAADNWTTTLTGLEMGTYYVNETAMIVGGQEVAIEEASYSVGGYFLDSTTYRVIEGTAAASARNNAVTLSDENAVVVQNGEYVVAAEVGVTNTYLRLENDTYVWPVLEVKKVRDTDNTPIAGVVFALYYNGKEIATATTGANGLAIFNFAGEGPAAKLKEIAEGNNGADITFTMKEKQEAPGYAENPAQYAVILHRVSESENLVDNSYLTTNTYFVKVDGQTATSTTAVFTVKNTVDAGTLTIQKTFGVNNAYTPASITVDITRNGVVYESVELDAANNWTYVLNQVSLDTYVVTEKSMVTHDGTEVVLDGSVTSFQDNGHTYYFHASSVTSATVELTSSTENGTASLQNTYTHQVVNPASFQIKKIGEDGKALSGATFALYDNENCTGTPVKTESTGSDGVATFIGFEEEGTYYLKETAAPAGYYLDDTIWQVKVELKNGAPVIEVNAKTGILETIFNWVASLLGKDNGHYADGILTVMNAKNTGLNILKKDVDTEQTVSGAGFTLYSDAACQTVVVSERIVGEDGTLNLPISAPGTYYLKETTTPTGYVVSDTVYTVEVKEESNSVGNYTVTTLVAQINGADVETISGAQYYVVENDKITGSLTITKEVAGLEDLDSVTFNITGPDSYSNTVTLTDADAVNGVLTKTLTGLELGSYTVAEQSASVDGYDLEVTYNGTVQASATVDLTVNNAANGVTVAVVNTYTVRTGNPVHNPGSFTVLKTDKNGTGLLGAVFTLKQGETVVAEGTTGTDGKYVFTGLQGSVDANGNPVAGIYTLTEKTAPTGYLATTASWTVTVDEEDGEVEVSLNRDGNFFQNIYDWVVEGITGNGATWDGTSLTLTVPNEKLVTVSVEKVWDDDNYYARPLSVTVALKRDNTEVATVTLNEDNDWAYTWEESYTDASGNTVPMTDANTWTVAEKVVPTGYTAAITHEGDDWTITNTREANIIDVTVTKEWVLNGKHHEAPESITVQLLCNGDPVNGEEVILNEENDWTYTWQDLSDADLWNVTEELVAGYDLNGIAVETANNGDLTFTIENERIVNNLSITVTKEWVKGEKNKKITFPTSVKVMLYKDGQKYETVTLSADNQWKYTWDDLTDEHQWTIEEKVPNGYIDTYKVTTTVYSDGSIEYLCAITNTYNSNPKTGDGMGFWMMGMTAPVLALFVLFLMGGKKKGKYQA